MSELPRDKRVEVAYYYLLGDHYSDIEKKTGVSHGTVVNVVSEVVTGRLDVHGTVIDQVNDQRQLALDLKRKGLTPSQALLGLTIFERANKAGIAPSHFDRWSALMKLLNQNGFPAAGFLNAALELHELQNKTGKPFNTLVEEYKTTGERLSGLEAETSSLETNKARLTKDLTLLSSQVGTMEATKKKTESEVDSLSTRKQCLKSVVKETKDEHALLKREIRQFISQRTKLAAEIDCQETVLNRINDIALIDQDLIRLQKFLETISQSGAVGQEKVKEQFLVALETYKDIAGLQNKRTLEEKEVNSLADAKAGIVGEIRGLELQRNSLIREIKASSADAIKQITDAGQNAASELHQQGESLKGQFNGLLAQAITAAKVVGEMNALVRKGEESEKSLKGKWRKV